jgi:hypothetical protein
VHPNQLIDVNRICLRLSPHQTHTCDTFRQGANCETRATLTDVCRTNRGPQIAISPIVFTDTLPAGLQYVGPVTAGSSSPAGVWLGTFQHSTVRRPRLQLTALRTAHSTVHCSEIYSSSAYSTTHHSQLATRHLGCKYESKELQSRKSTYTAMAVPTDNVSTPAWHKASMHHLVPLLNHVLCRFMHQHHWRG